MMMRTAYNESLTAISGIVRFNEQNGYNVDIFLSAELIAPADFF